MITVRIPVEYSARRQAISRSKVSYRKRHAMTLHTLGFCRGSLLDRAEPSSRQNARQANLNESSADSSVVLRGALQAGGATLSRKRIGESVSSGKIYEGLRSPSWLASCPTTVRSLSAETRFARTGYARNSLSCRIFSLRTAIVQDFK